MVIVKIQGGLGNQMFQYAAAKSITKSGRVYLDLIFITNNTVSNTGFTARDLEITLFKNTKIKTANSLISKIYRSSKFKLPWLRLLLKITKLTDDNFNSAPDFKNHYLDGYFQNPKYFEKIRAELLKDFEFPEVDKTTNFLKETIENTKNSVALHVRRGDYLKPEVNKHHGVLPIKYYQGAFTYVESHLDDTHYFIFSDDPEWCSTNFDFIKKKTILSGNQFAWTDMYLMGCCKHNIVANSSFSWWGAWLNQNIDKIVVAPKKWFNSIETNIVPPTWICL